MEELFLTVLNMSIAAGWLILAVLLLRLPMKKAPRWLVCLLWAVVGLRLVCPFSPQSRLSLIPSAQTFSEDILYSETPSISSGVQYLNDAVNPVLEESLSPEVGASINPMQVVTLIAAAVWLVGAAAMAIYALVSWLRLRRMVRASVPCGEGMLICDGIPSPFILGLFRPRIYLPSELDGHQAELAARHERMHIARRDHIWKPLGFLLLSVYWFNPLCWVAYILLCRDIEAACDERVIRSMPLSERKKYSEALLACSMPRRAVAACPLAFGETGVGTRVREVLNYRKPAFWVIILAAAACVAVSVCFLTNPVSDGQLRVGGGLYTESGETSKLPVDAVSVGRLVSVETSSRRSPDISMTGTNLGSRYEGREIYECESDPSRVYLENPDGGWLMFETDGTVYRPVICAFDYSDPDSVSSDGRSLSFTLPEYHDVEFICGTDAVTAVTSEGTAELFCGAPLLNVCFADLDGDGQREICGTAYSETGTADARIYVYNYCDKQLYELSDPGTFDYRLTLRGSRPLAVKSPCGEVVPLETGWLALSGGALVTENVSTTDGQLYVTDKSLYVNPLSSVIPSDDNGQVYCVDLEWNAITVINRETGELIAEVQDVTAQWEQLTDEDIAAIFMLGTDGVTSRGDLELLRLTDGYCLFRTENELWVGEGLNENTGVWYVWSLRLIDSSVDE